MSKWTVDPIQMPPRTKGRPTPEGVPLETREDPTLAAKRRFFEWLAAPLTRMSKELDVPRDVLFNLAVKEGGWLGDQLDHNIPLNNPFGVNRINEKGQAAGNQAYKSVDAAVDEWIRMRGESVRGVQTREEFVRRLQHPEAPAKPYNSQDPDWAKKFMDINVKKWREKCGIPK